MSKITGAICKTSSVCHLCGFIRNNVVLYGELYKILDLHVHYFCILLSTAVKQNGKDEEGIGGFLYNDIKALVNSHKTKCCSYCRRPGATILCKYRRCMAQFHLPCGIEHGAMPQFEKSFSSYCGKHRPKQRITETRINCNFECVICINKVDPSEPVQSLWAPCCRNWYHRLCISKMALSAGSLFKCPTCNDKKYFRKEMKHFGVYVPVRDASWEREPNAFAELQQPPQTCNAPNCFCPKGVAYSRKGTTWGIVKCKFCGSHAVHVKCGLLRRDTDEWSCDGCGRIANNQIPVGVPATSTGSRYSTAGQKRRRSLHGYGGQEKRRKFTVAKLRALLELHKIKEVNVVLRRLPYKY